MRASARGRAMRPLTTLTSILLASAIAVPAMAQIENVIVSAQKKDEDIQTVPIAVTAFGAEDLAARQIEEFRDLQFNVPSVTYTKSNFSGSNFQVRGIGVTAIGTSADTGVAIHVNDFYLNAPRLAETEYYDIERLELSRGPQSTLYGRNATGGSVNIITAKPNLEEAMINAEATYGNYDTRKFKGMINVPFDDTFGVRVSGLWLQRDGYTENALNGDDIDDRDLWSVRASARWQPDDDTTFDFLYYYFWEEDSRMRSQKQLCDFDPTGVLGCLPTGRGFDHINPNSTLATIFTSEEGIRNLFGWSGAGAVLGVPLGLYSLTTPATLVPGANPTDMRKIFTDFTPTYESDETIYMGSWKQHWADWLDMTLVAGWQDTSVWSQASYNNIPGATFDPLQLATSTGTFAALAPTAHAAVIAPCGGAGLPLSGIGNNGITGGNSLGCFNNIFAYDQSDGWAEQWSTEIRFNTSFDGPLNFMLAAYYLDFLGSANYWVSANTLDYAGLLVGSIAVADGFVLAPTQYYNNTPRYTLESTAFFGEAYFDAIPEELKFTLGLRWTQDDKQTRARTTLYNCFMPLGTTNIDDSLDPANTPPIPCAYDADPGVAGRQQWADQTATFEEWTGRFVVDWTPDLDFTDATLIYASYARGFKSGGMNPPLSVGTGVPRTYEPELIDAYEVGTKNTLLDATLQANIVYWYYNYTGLQVSKIFQRTSVNENIDAKLWGLEGEFLWQPDDRWTFNLNIAHTNSEIADVSSIDTRNPTAGRNDLVLLKALGQASNCVIYKSSGTAVTAADIAALEALQAFGAGFFQPTGPGSYDDLAGAGVPNVMYGPTCDFGAPSAAGLIALLGASGFSVSDPSDPGRAFAWDGVPVSLEGNSLQNTPEWTIAIGAQYAMPINSYTLTARVDYYWQDDMWGRIFNAGAADLIESWDVMNASLLLTAPDNTWYAKLFVQNVFNDDNVTGMYLTDQSSGLFTNVFLGDPRLIGITIGANL